MSETYQEAVEVAGSFADLGLETPGSFEMPSRGLPDGTHRVFLKNARFVQNKKDATKRNLELTFEVNEPGSPVFGKTHTESKAANPGDSAKTKGFLVARLNDLGIATGDIPTTNPRSLIGNPYYMTIGPQRDNPDYKEIKRLVADTDGEHVNVVQPPVGSHAAPSAPVTTSVDY